MFLHCFACLPVNFLFEDIHFSVLCLICVTFPPLDDYIAFLLKGLKFFRHNRLKLSLYEFELFVGKLYGCPLQAAGQSFSIFPYVIVGKCGPFRKKKNISKSNLAIEIRIECVGTYVETSCTQCELLVLLF